MRSGYKERVSDWYAFAGVSLWLGGQAIWRLTVPAREMLNGPFTTVEFYLDLAMLALVVWSSSNLARRSDGPKGLRSARPLLAMIGIAGGVTVLAIRLLTDNGWFSGHLDCCTGYLR